MAGLGFSFGLANMLARLSSRVASPSPSPSMPSGSGDGELGNAPAVSYRFVDLLGGEEVLDRLVDRGAARWVRDSSGRPSEYRLPLRAGGEMRFVLDSSGMYRLRVGDREFSRPFRFDPSTSRFVLELANASDEPLVRGELSALLSSGSPAGAGGVADAGPSGSSPGPGGVADAGNVGAYRFLTIPVYEPRVGVSSPVSPNAPVGTATSDPSTVRSRDSDRESFMEQMMPILLMLAMSGRFGSGGERGRGDYPIIIG